MSVQECFYELFLGGVEESCPNLLKKIKKFFLENKKRIFKPKQISIEYSFNL